MNRIPAMRNVAPIIIKGVKASSSGPPKNAGIFVDSAPKSAPPIRMATIIDKMIKSLISKTFTSFSAGFASY